jgi:hypothetical protein
VIAGTTGRRFYMATVLARPITPLRPAGTRPYFVLVAPDGVVEWGAYSRAEVTTELRLGNYPRGSKVLGTNDRDPRLCGEGGRFVS